MENKIAEIKTNHFFELDNRKSMKLTGVLEIISATDSFIQLKTECGNLSISGTELNIQELSIDEKKLNIKGIFNEIKYNAVKKPLLSRIFK